MCARFSLLRLIELLRATRLEAGDKALPRFVTVAGLQQRINILPKRNQDL